MAHEGVRAPILLVDDRPANLLVLEAILEQLGEELVRASSGKAAIEQIGQREFALVLLDVLMPGMDGFETASRIRTLGSHADVPILFISALEDRDSDLVRRCYQVGAADFLTKPIVPEILRSKVQFFATMYRKELELRSMADLLRAEVSERTALLRQTEKRLRLLLESVTDYAIIILDPDGRVVDWSVGAEQIFGYTAEEMLGTNARELFTSHDRSTDIPEREMERARETGRAEDERWHLNKSGALFLRQA